MPHIAYVPADAEQNIEVVEVEEARIFEWASTRTGIDLWDSSTFGHAGFMLLVDDLGYVREETPPINQRITDLAVSNGRHPEAIPFVGDAIILGVDPAGDTVDVPTEVVLELA